MKKYTKTIVLVVLYIFMTLLPFAIYTSRGQSIWIDKTNHVLYAYQGRWNWLTVPITAGSELAPTSTGEFSVISKIKNVSSYHGYTFPLWLGVYTVGANNEYENGIHSVDGNNPWTDNIGVSNSTAGSIILTKKDMWLLYIWAKTGTYISIYN